MDLSQDRLLLELESVLGSETTFLIFKVIIIIIIIIIINFFSNRRIRSWQSTYQIFMLDTSGV
jgi:hypothetical protein